MENWICYFPVISLEQMALRRTAAVLVSKAEILATTDKFTSKYVLEGDQVKWIRIVTSKIMDLTSKLLLPASLTREIIPILKAVASELLLWRAYHRLFEIDFKEDFTRIAPKLYWNSRGSIDYQKTSEILVCSAVFDKLQTFKLACLHCLEDYIPKLWGELSGEDRQFFENAEHPLEVDPSNLEWFLPYIFCKYPLFRCLLIPLAEMRRNLLTFAAICGNKAAFEYCLKKLPKETGHSSVIKTALSVLQVNKYHSTCERCSGLLCFLLSQMTPEERLRVVKKSPDSVFRLFLAWPYQDLIFENADVIWSFLPENEYWRLMNILLKHMTNVSYYFPNIMQEFFLRSPTSFRKKFADSIGVIILFFEQFYLAGDSQTIKEVFRILDDADKKKIIFNEDILQVLDDFLNKGGWHLVEMCLREASLSKDDREKLREAFRENVKFDYWSTVSINKTENRKRFYKFLDELDTSTEKKRRAEDETISQIKKVCNVKNDTFPRN